MNRHLWTIIGCSLTSAALATPPQAGQPGGAANQDVLNDFMPGARGATTTPPTSRRSATTTPAAKVEPAVAQPLAAEQPAAAAGANVAQPAANRMFTVIDANGDGLINAAELRRAATALRTLDANGDGSISLAEASSANGLAAPAPGAGGAQPSDQMFAQYDKNGDGKLMADEVPPNMARVFRQMDANGDAVVTRDEFAAAAAAAAASNQFGGMMGGAMNPQMTQQIMQQMAQFDRNGDGRLQPGEVPPQMGPGLQGADRNGDGAIDANEMMTAMGQMGGRGPADRFPVNPVNDGRGPRRGGGQ
jgi:Ca2+-binding EF-hand superfamily protein